MRNAPNQPTTDAEAGRIAHVQQGVTQQIVWQDLSEDRLVIPVNDMMRESVEREIQFASARGSLTKMVAYAHKRLRENFSTRIRDFSTSDVHDGELIITVRPIDGMFDVPLGIELGELADELEDYLAKLLEEVDSSIERFMIGFRQETGDAEETAD